VKHFLRTRLRFLSLAWTLALLFVSVGPVQADTVKCQRAIAKSSAKYSAARTKALASCETARLAGTLPDATDCRSAIDTAATIASAATKMRSTIAKACGGTDKTCGADTTGEDTPASTGWPAICPGFPEASCANAIDDCAGIADCLLCIHDAAVDAEVELFFSSLPRTDPVADQALNRCQVALGSATTRYLSARTKSLQSCWDGRLLGKHDNACPDPGNGKAAVKNAAAAAKRDATICKACGGRDKACDGTDDFDASQILGATPTCPAVVLPGGEDCGALGTVSTLSNILECGACFSDFQADCADAAREPQFGAYPAGCAGGDVVVLESIEIAPISPMIVAGRTGQLTATGHFSDGSSADVTETADWTSSVPATATVSNSSGTRGLVTGLVQGATTVTATIGAVSMGTSVTVTAPELVSIAVTPANASVSAGTPQQFTATGTYTDSSTQNLTSAVVWASSNTAAATISNAMGSAGLATTVAAGTSNISAQSGMVSGQTTLTVTPALGPCGLCPPETPVCNTANGHCVQCLTDFDCLWNIMEPICIDFTCTTGGL
jgi:hypothetical protein